MVRKKLVIERKTITAPMVITELELWSQETGKSFCSISYDTLVEKIVERIKNREMSNNIIHDKQTVNTLKFEVSRILDKYTGK